jgi:hypothetical protein
MGKSIKRCPNGLFSFSNILRMEINKKSIFKTKNE